MYHGHPEVVRILLEAGADVNAENSNGRTAFDLVSQTLGRVYRPVIESTLLRAAGHGKIALGMPLLEGVEATGAGDERSTATMMPFAEAEAEANDATHAASDMFYIMQAPPGAVPGERLIVTLVGEKAMSVTVPEWCMEGGRFLVRMPANVRPATDSPGRDASSAAASYGRPLGAPLPTIDRHALGVVALSVGDSALARIDELARQIGEAEHMSPRQARMRAFGASLPPAS